MKGTLFLWVKKLLMVGLNDGLNLVNVVIRDLGWFRVKVWVQAGFRLRVRVNYILLVPLHTLHTKVNLLHCKLVQK